MWHATLFSQSTYMYTDMNTHTNLNFVDRSPNFIVALTNELPVI